MISALRRFFGERLARFLSKSLPGYRRIDTIPVDAIAEVLRPGDVVLVEGNTRISIAIKYLTQSSWSHSCLYIGRMEDAKVQHGLLEADLREGVRVVPLDHYRDFNLRICRPVSLKEEEIAELIAFGKSKLGHQYDLKNVVDLIRYLIQRPAVPTRFRRSMIGLGSGEPTKAICSTLIAESFQAINYPILPRLGPESGKDGEVPIYYRRHFTHFTPRDFDLSPYFQVVKPTLEHGFDYHDFNWTEEPGTDSDNSH
ncbi:MAG: YiiX/YebB-like N1pC/P60 family cysteine hydrolase [Proteobacteria bacterium]|nr:YiiX/YebB-like N1pC/P60 family cysteine hydrolase [Pseudomonadota bacterium]MDA0929548.1 YiiX/YebB-like N1pC/P60 family cysteine hydrolase [Pseudomonadota bacterium]